MKRQSDELLLRTVEYLNAGSGSIDAIGAILKAVKTTTDVEAVGIRLTEGEDYPYYTTLGFPERFVEKERFLCQRRKDGQLVRDKAGSPVLECMCGNVICGRTDPTLPFFTSHGSFWTNSTTDLLASTSEEERQARTRNTCHGEGYESVALIPLRNDKGVIGLLQLNDRRRNLFCPDDIAFFERLGASVGVALTKRKNEEALAYLNANLERLVGERTAELSAALEAKSVLLKEVHHRVKNNLQITASLLKLQALSTPPECGEALMKAVSRVNSMGIVHARLYESKGTAFVSMDRYVNDLVRDVFSTFSVPKEKILTFVDCNDVMMNYDTATPFGMILNELLVNAVKHAFPGDRCGSVRLTLAREGSGFRFVFADDGIGLPDGFSLGGGGLGMQIVERLVDQLDGRVRFTSTGGTKFEIVFAAEGKEELRWNREPL